MPLLSTPPAAKICPDRSSGYIELHEGQASENLALYRIDKSVMYSATVPGHPGKRRLYPAKFERAWVQRLVWWA